MKPESQLQQVSDFISESDYDLIGYMALAKDDPVGAQLAWEQFYFRHAPYLLRVLTKRYTDRFVPDSIESLLSATMLRAFEKAETFRASDESDPDRQRRHVRAWLGKISENIVLSAFRKTKGIELIYADAVDGNGHDGWVRVFSEVEEKKARPDAGRDPLWQEKQTWVREAFENLNEKERQVLLVTLEFDQPGKENQKLPSGIAKKLAEAVGSTPENVRQIRVRAKRKIREYVERKLREKK